MKGREGEREGGKGWKEGEVISEQFGLRKSLVFTIVKIVVRFEAQEFLAGRKELIVLLSYTLMQANESSHPHCNVLIQSHHWYNGE